jgi:hypothetical protein
VRENRTHGSEGGDGESRFRPLSLMLISVLSLLGAVARAGEAPNWKEDWERTLQAAKKEGQLVIYGSAEYEQLYAEFHKKYPEIKVTGVFGRGADVTQRIMAGAAR